MIKIKLFSYYSLFIKLFYLFLFFLLSGTQGKLIAQSVISQIDSMNKIAEQFMVDGLFDSAQLIFEKQIELAENGKLPIEVARANKRLGICYEFKGDYDKALEKLYEALRLAEKLDDKQEIASVFINIGVMYFDLRKADDAIEYYKKGLEVAEANNDSINMIRALNNTGNALMTLKLDLEGSVPYFERTVELGKKTGFETAVKVGLTNLTQIYTETNRLDKARKVAREVLKMDLDGDYPNYNMGNIFRKQNQPDSALYYMLIAAKPNGAEPEFKLVVLKDISDLFAEKNEYKSSLEYFSRYANLKDSIHTQASEKNMMEIKTRYEAEKKDLEIEQLSLANSRRLIIIAALSVLVVSGLSIGLMMVRNARKKRQIAFQQLQLKELQITQLENEKLIVASTAAFKGEESERNRLARDLHDGLGGLLTGLKLNMNNMKNHVILDEATQKMFSHALKLLDNSIAEMHQVANNMMPEILIRLGISRAIDNFIESLDTKDISIDYQVYGTENRYDLNFELTVYRSVQEIINNAMKHSGATKLDVQFVADLERMCLTVNDNGKGFEPSNLQMKGNGLGNIKARVITYGGHFDLNSKPDEGTEIIIEFGNLKNFLNNDSPHDC